MTGFVELTTQEARHAQRLALFQRLRRHQQLARHIELATTRLARSIKTDAKLHTRHQIAWLAELTAHEAESYRSLAHRAGAIHYCDLHIAHALRALSLKAGP